MRRLAYFESRLESRVKEPKPTTLRQMAKPNACITQFLSLFIGELDTKPRLCCQSFNRFVRRLMTKMLVPIVQWVQQFEFRTCSSDNAWCQRSLVLCFSTRGSHRKSGWAWKPVQIRHAQQYRESIHRYLCQDRDWNFSGGLWPCSVRTNAVPACSVFCPSKSGLPVNSLSIRNRRSTRCNLLATLVDLGISLHLFGFFCTQH